MIEKLISLNGYNVIEIGEFNGINGLWGAVKKYSDYNDVLLFSTEDMISNLNVDDLKLYIKNSLNIYNAHLNIILLTESNYADNIIETIKIKEIEEFSTILNYKDRVIFYSGIKSSQLVKDITYVPEEKRELSHIVNNNRKIPVITYSIIVINILFYIVTMFLSGNLFNSDINVLVMLGAKVNYLIDQGEYYRFITCMFLHGGLMHIALNMYALYAIGPLVESYYGKIKYLIIYFISGIVSSVFSYKFSDSVSIGASGAIFGLLGATLILAYRNKHKIGKGFMQNIISVIVINLIIGLSIHNVDNFGHIGGLIGGLLVSLIIFLVSFKEKEVNKM
ncbi:rhomboid family intramembrane serine protease [Clostridium oceanicum]|uniref:Rhomboid family intramembrane serine protease n=1 Tax=Clostridium oceanicum TaxID=1543 RepID=A0ABN1JRA7_9CLOT